MSNKLTFLDNQKDNKVLLDDNFYFGKGVFETIYYDQNPILLKDHIDRLNKSAKKIGIANRLDLKDVEEFIKSNLKYKKGIIAIKIVITDKNKLITFRNVPYKDKDYKEGFSLKLSSVTRNSSSLLTYIKSTNYIENIIEKQKAKDEGFNEVIFLNEKGLLTEGATSNIFFIKNNIIYTPKIECGLLSGIMRNWVIKNFKVEEGYFTLGDLKEADEIFITNSLVGVMKVYKLKDLIFERSDITESIRAVYLKYIKEEKNG